MLPQVIPKRAFVFFINTGNASTTRGTWLWLAQQAGGTFGTWRTSNGGATWVQVDKNEQPGGASQIYQPGTTGVVYMAGVYSALGSGVLRSNDYGQTWTHVGMTNNETVVVGTSNDRVFDVWSCCWPRKEHTIRSLKLRPSRAPALGWRRELRPP